MSDRVSYVGQQGSEGIVRGGTLAVVRKAVSGPTTDAMDVHYSTAHKPEVARALGNLFDLATARAKKVGR